MTQYAESASRCRQAITIGRADRRLGLVACSAEVWTYMYGQRNICGCHDTTTTVSASAGFTSLDKGEARPRAARRESYLGTLPLPVSIFVPSFSSDLPFRIIFISVSVSWESAPSRCETIPCTIPFLVCCCSSPCYCSRCCFRLSLFLSAASYLSLDSLG
ncbi:hypothetical protein VTK56DRAFT_7810 [Thermocarpiscus australiensis]